MQLVRGEIKFVGRELMVEDIGRLLCITIIWVAD
jgi:hypothetical protein